MAKTDSSKTSAIPFGQEFTPSTLGKSLGEDQVLGWLLNTASESGTRPDFSAAIQETCLAHIQRSKDRRDMASHVITAMRSYKLIEIADGGRISLTRIAERLRAARGEARDCMFARHILTSCQGQRLVDAILKYQIRGEKPRLEDLARELENQPTSKSISTMRAWLARAGVFEGKGYRVDQAAIASLLGSNVAAVLALQPDEMELVIAARLLEQQSGGDFVRASEAMTLAEARNPHLRTSRKALGSFIKALRDREVLEIEKERGVGGTGWTVRLLGASRELTTEELRGLVEQSSLSFGLHELLPLEEALEKMSEGSAYQRGLAGEMVAIHLCLVLGLRIERWRHRAPASEIDLIADRLVGLTYQRWAIQVKNTVGKLDIDRVDREIGSAAGLGVTHLLFVIPRASVTEPARVEMIAKSRLTGLTVLFLGEKELAGGVKLETILRQLEAQAALAAFAQRKEAQRREEGDV